MRRRLLTIGHSYAVALNRRLADELARAGGNRWEVEVAAPAFVRGDLRPIPFEPGPPGGARAHPVPAYLTGRPHLFGYGRAARRLVRGGGWDLVHAWQEPYVFAGWQLARWAGRAPLTFLTFQNIAKTYPPPASWFERATLGRAAGWVAAGHTVRQTLTPRLNYAQKPSAVIPVGVDLAAFAPNRAAGEAVRRGLGWPPEGPPVVGYLGRFTPEKGLRTLCAALEAVAAPWRALFVGGGPLEAELRAWAARFPGRAAVATGVPHAGVPAHLNAMDLLAAPSETTPNWREQLGRMLIEAFAAGVPVVGSDSGEIPLVVADAGRVVPEADAAAWARTLGELLESPGLRRDLAARGAERARGHYAWPVVAALYLAFFESILEARAAA